MCRYICICTYLFINHIILFIHIFSESGDYATAGLTPDSSFLTPKPVMSSSAAARHARDVTAGSRGGVTPAVVARPRRDASLDPLRGVKRQGGKENYHRSNSNSNNNNNYNYNTDSDWETEFNVTR